MNRSHKISSILEEQHTGRFIFCTISDLNAFGVHDFHTFIQFLDREGLGEYSEYVPRNPVNATMHDVHLSVGPEELQYIQGHDDLYVVIFPEHRYSQAHDFVHRLQAICDTYGHDGSIIASHAIYNGTTHSFFIGDIIRF